MKQSIRSISTKGLKLSDRRDLLNKYEKIPVGDTVWGAGDAFEPEHEVIVTEQNQDMVTMFWNSLYFDNRRDASIVTEENMEEYNDYLERSFEQYGIIDEI